MFCQKSVQKGEGPKTPFVGFHKQGKISVEKKITPKMNKNYFPDSGYDFPFLKVFKH